MSGLSNTVNYSIWFHYIYQFPECIFTENFAELIYAVVLLFLIYYDWENDTVDK